MNKLSRFILSVLLVIAFLVISQNKLGNNAPVSDLEKEADNIRVIDGDTLELNGKRIRLYGIDAFEKSQQCYKHHQSTNCGELAKAYLEFLLVGKQIKCNKKSVDRYGRDVSVCTVDGLDIGKQMVRQGWAKAYRKYSLDYVQDEELAQKYANGAWTKDFVSPEEIRRK